VARLPRLSIPGLPHLVVQRALTTQPAFAEQADYLDMLSIIGQQARQHEIAVHAYTLLPGEMQLLLTPRAQASLSRFMQSVSRMYVPAFNRRHQRRGTLWEGRYRAAVLEPEAYLLACMTYIDLAAQHAGLAAPAEAYSWSSTQHYLGVRHDPILTPHAGYWALGNTPFARQARYQALIQQGLTSSQCAAIDNCANKSWALGDDDFLAEIQQHTQRRVRAARPGRPRGSSAVLSESGAGSPKV
tara:strand:+ start:2815 stop:3543 length:729 start_codon:yes stop_codon:yes gene_type:complete